MFKGIKAFANCEQEYNTHDSPNINISCLSTSSSNKKHVIFNYEQPTN